MLPLTMLATGIAGIAGIIGEVKLDLSGKDSIFKWPKWGRMTLGYII